MVLEPDIITSPASITISAILELRVWEIPAKLDWVPERFLDHNNVSAWTDLPVWVPRHGDTAGFARRDIRRALAAGLTFRPLVTTAKETLAWFETQPPARQAKLRAGLTGDREAQLLAQWKAKA